MVHTRHSVDTDGDSPDALLSLEPRRKEKPQRIVLDDEHSDDSGVVHIKRHGRLRHSYEPQTTPLPRVTRRKRIIEDSADDEDPEPLPGRTLRVRRTKMDLMNGDHDMMDMMNGEDDDHVVRRSSRQRKLLYSTFDQNILGKVHYIEHAFDTEDSSKKRKTRSREVEPVDVGNLPDMYSRVKRVRQKVKRDMYGIPIQESGSETEETSDDNEEDPDDKESKSSNKGAKDDSNDEDEDDDDEEEDEDDDDDDDEDDEEDNIPPKRSYYLREHKPRTKLFEVQIEKRRPRPPPIFRETSPVVQHRKPKVYRSPAHRKRNIRRKAAFHGSSSTSSSSSSDDGDGSSDEERFQRRKAKSMARARNRCLPMNISTEDAAMSGVIRDRMKIGSSLADVDPMTIDKSVTFDSVGGLGKHIRALKEMIVFPLLYPEVFEKFKINPPRGCLFYGPPGTGKTLVARALANECSSGDRRVAFFMRKGADCLSKWVGESERQLRLLFDQAYQMRPSIIFFDEIDGLAPVRSSRQDQIHSSIVSTLLALMDGLDSRGEIVVIGATNRIDSIDPALRRPGRFDREFLFPLPSQEARRQIMHIHTKAWTPRLCDTFVKELSEKTVGYCGADLRALCTEAALLALRRRYPQIYTTSEKLQLDVSAINISAKDFFYAMQTIVPASQRAVTSPARALSVSIQPLLKTVFNQTLKLLQGVFPTVLAQLSNLDAQATSSQGDGANIGEDFISDDDEHAPSIFEPKGRRSKGHTGDSDAQFLSYSSSVFKYPSTHRPRLLLAGHQGQGQTSHIGPAVLHHMEQLPVHVLDLPSLFAVSAKTPEESCAQIFREARRTSPSIIYMPHINQWWTVLSETLRATFLTLVHDLVPSSPILVLATCEQQHSELDIELQMMFNIHADEVVHMSYPTEEERQEFFSDLLLCQAVKPPSKRKQAENITLSNPNTPRRSAKKRFSKLTPRARRILEVLPKAPPPEPRKLTEQELKVLYDQEEVTLRELRLFLRDVINKLGRDRKFQIFTKPVDIEDVPDYYEIIKKPMDLTTMMSKIDLHRYQTGKEFVSDIDLICHNALEYNPAKDPTSRAIRHRACALKDTAHAIIKAELDPEFEKQCEEVMKSRKRRGINPSDSAPNYYHTPPVQKSSELSASQQINESAADAAIRKSRRMMGLNVEQVAPLEMIERQWRIEKRLSASPEKKETRHRSPSPTKIEPVSDRKPKTLVKKEYHTPNITKKSAPKKKCVWSYTKRRKRRRITVTSVHKDEEETEEDNYDAETELEGENETDEEEERNPKKVLRDTSPTVVLCDRLPRASDSKRKDNSSQDVSSSRRDISPRDNRSSRRDTSPREGTSTNRDLSPKDKNDLSPVGRRRTNSLRSQGSDHTTKDRSPSSHHKSSPADCPVYSAEHSTTNSVHTENSTSPVFKRKAGSHIKTADDSQIVEVMDIPPKSPENMSFSKDNNPKESQVSDKNTTSKTLPSTKEDVGSNIEVDSGISSCVDSNGDSLDSVDQAKQISGKKTMDNQTGGLTEAETEKKKDAEDTQKEDSSAFRVTRSRLQSKQQERALAILEEPSQPVIVDKERLLLLLNTVVKETHKYNIEKLEKLYSILSQCIYHHREEYDKTELTRNLELCVKRFVGQMSVNRS